MQNYAKLFRVKHYLKNILIFFPLIFSGKILENQNFIITTIGFFSYCLCSSCVYIINDLKDMEKDAKHPIKKNRPLASGAISKKNAIFCLFLLFLFVTVSQIYLINSFSIGNTIGMSVCIFVYLIINIGYSFGLKNIAILDLLILSSGFLIRILYGGFLTNIQISNWLFLTVLSLSLYAGLGKRRNEKIKNQTKSRNVLKYYNQDFLDKNMYMFLATSLVFYSLWCTNNGIFIEDSKMIISIPFLYYLVLRYSLIIEGDSYGDPIDILLKDKILLLGSILYGIVMVVLIYA